MNSYRETFRTLRLLVVEADAARRRDLSQLLAQRGHDASIVATGFDGLQLALSGDFDVVVVDTRLPDADGFQILRMIRAVSDVAVVATVGSERSLAPDVDVVADDYLVEPYTVDQLEYRVRMLVRRLDRIGDRRAVTTVGGLTVDQVAREVHVDSNRLELSRKEFDLLAYLASKPEEVVSRRELAEEVWGDPYGGSDRTVDVHLSWLRSKLGESAAHPRYIRTVRGVGVKLVDPRSITET